MDSESSSKKRILIIFIFLCAYVVLVMAETLAFVWSSGQSNYRLSSLNGNRYCLLVLVIVIAWQSLIVAALSWTPRHWWLPISKLNLIVLTFFLPLTLTIVVGPAVVTAFPALIRHMVNPAKFFASYRPGRLRP